VKVGIGIVRVIHHKIAINIGHCVGGYRGFFFRGCYHHVNGCSLDMRVRCWFQILYSRVYLVFFFAVSGGWLLVMQIEVLNPMLSPHGEVHCEFDLLFYNSQSQANWSGKNGQALPAVRGEISSTEI
jgi:hypothetical protein